MVRSWSAGSPRTISPPTAPQPKPSTESCIPVRPKARNCIAVPPTACTLMSWRAGLAHQTLRNFDVRSFPRGAVEQRTTLQGNAEHLGSFEIDDHLGVRSLLLFNDGTPEACRSFPSYY